MHQGLVRTLIIVLLIPPFCNAQTVADTLKPLNFKVKKQADRGQVHVYITVNSGNLTYFLTENKVNVEKSHIKKEFHPRIAAFYRNELGYEQVKTLSFCIITSSGETTSMECSNDRFFTYRQINQVQQLSHVPAQLVVNISSVTLMDGTVIENPDLFDGQTVEINGESYIGMLYLVR